jgi:RNA polymerase II subunit A-like phosphatase
MKDEAADLQIVPDIGEVMPQIKANSLKGTSIVLSGLVPLGVDVLRSEIAIQSISFGAQIHTKISRKVTHLVVAANRTRTQKVRQATSYPHIKIVNQQWLVDSMSRWEKVDETPYLINIHREDKSTQQELFDGQNLDESSGDESEGDGNSSHDDDADMPDDFEGGQSPIEGLKDVDWSAADAELEEFMASGSESDTESVASSTSPPSQPTYLQPPTNLPFPQIQATAANKAPSASGANANSPPPAAAAAAATTPTRKATSPKSSG